MLFATESLEKLVISLNENNSHKNVIQYYWTFVNSLCKHLLILQIPRCKIDVVVQAWKESMPPFIIFSRNNLCWRFQEGCYTWILISVAFDLSKLRVIPLSLFRAFHETRKPAFPLIYFWLIYRAYIRSTTWFRGCNARNKNFARAHYDSAEKNIYALYTGIIAARTFDAMQ